MEYEIMPYTEADVDAMIEIWNEVVRDGAAFPQLDELNHKTGVEFFGRQDFAGVAKVNGEVAGLYILHPISIVRYPSFNTCFTAFSTASMGMERRTEQLISWSKSQLRVFDNTRHPHSAPKYHS